MHLPLIDVEKQKRIAHNILITIRQTIYKQTNRKHDLQHKHIQAEKRGLPGYHTDCIDSL